MITSTRTEEVKPGPKTHKIKIWPQFIKPVASGRKPFEIRYNDRNYKVGDKLVMEGWDPEKHEYTGEQIDAVITYCLWGGQFGIEYKYVGLGIKVLGTNF